MNKFLKIFNPSNNWKTTLVLILFLTNLTFFLTVFMGYQFANNEGKFESYYLLTRNSDKSLKYIKHIFNCRPDDNNEIFKEKIVYNPGYVYALISYYNLWIYLAWFIIPISFCLNHFKLIHLVGKTRRTANASIVFISSIVILILVINYWIGYYQWIDILNKNKWHGSNTWTFTWQTILEKSLLLFVTILFILMSLYNIIVEQKTKYLSIDKKEKKTKKINKNEYKNINLI